MAAVIALNAEDLVEPDFSKDAWREFQAQMLVEQGVDLTGLYPPHHEMWMIDGEQSLFHIWIDVQALRNMWLRSEDSWINRATDVWINDRTIPPHDWMSPGRGEDAYWWIGSRYVIGITAMDIESAEVTE